MFKSSSSLFASLRYRRPYWMLFLKGVDNWKIYTVIQQPDHQRTEMLYQAWLGGLDRPYVRPKCMAHQPVWLTKKRHLLRKSRLQGPETHLEKYLLEWYQLFHCFQGTQRPSFDDLHTAFDLVERPLDLSYACQLLSQCRNHFNIRLGEDSLEIFLEACLRVGRKDCAVYALENSATLGFWHVKEDVAKFLRDEQSWYKISSLDGRYYPLEGNEERNKTIDAETGSSPTNSKLSGDTLGTLNNVEDRNGISGVHTLESEMAQSITESTVAREEDGTTEELSAYSTPLTNKSEGTTGMESEEDELARLEEELRALEEEENRLRSKDSSKDE